MSIHQINVSHDPREDRLLMRLNTQQGEEFRFWLTRRLYLQLTPVLQEALGRLESLQPGRVANDPHTQALLGDLQRESFLQEANFSTPYDEKAQTLPLGQTPMLITDAQISFSGQGNMVLVLEDKGASPASSCRLDLPSKLVHGLIHLIGQAGEKAGWRAGSDPRPQAAAADGQRPQYTH